jgi:t-SNARE complex subunit (syntaxin)
MAQDSQPPAYSTDMANDPPPSYVEAMEGVQLSPRQLLTRQEMTQVMIDQQWSNLQHNTANINQERLIAPVQQKKKGRCIPIIVVIVIIKIIVIICIRSEYN